MPTNCSKDSWCRRQCDSAESTVEKTREKENVLGPAPSASSTVRHWSAPLCPASARLMSTSLRSGWKEFNHFMISLRRTPKTHTVPPNTDRFCGADVSQEIETATDAGCKHSEFLMSRPRATSQLLVQILLCQWHSDFRTLILQFRPSAPQLYNRYLHNGKKG